MRLKAEISLEKTNSWNPSCFPVKMYIFGFMFSCSSVQMSYTAVHELRLTTLRVGMQRSVAKWRKYDNDTELFGAFVPLIVNCSMCVYTEKRKARVLETLSEPAWSVSVIIMRGLAIKGKKPGGILSSEKSSRRVRRTVFTSSSSILELQLALLIVIQETPFLPPASVWDMFWNFFCQQLSPFIV